MINRILLVAWTELSATLLTRAFIMMVLTPIIAVLSAPLIAGPIVLVAEMTANDAAEAAPALPIVEVFDATGRVAPALGERIDEDWQIALLEAAPGPASEGLYDSEAEARLVLEADALSTGTYTVYYGNFLAGEDARDNLDSLMKQTDALLGEVRLVEAGLTPGAVEEALSVEGALERVEVSADEAVNRIAELAEKLVPAGVLFMMFSALSMAGQGLLTSTLEEKSTRVAEVLLGAVSPVELLTGKVLGQLGVSVIFSVVWGLPTLALLGWFGVYYLGPITVIYVLIFIGLASVSWAAVMGGIGSAVNDLTEAQHLLAPLFMVMMVFFIPAGFAIVAPESNLVLAASLLPPSSPAVMAVRLTTSAPPPHWQVWISLLTSGAFAAFLLVLAGRLFRIGLLLRGAPPNVRTLIRWVMTS